MNIENIYHDYSKTPPTIDEFLDDNYYLGVIGKTIFPFWREKLREIFPTPVHTKYPIVILSGSIGTGKSTFARILEEYMKCRILCLSDPYKSIGLLPGESIKFTFSDKSSIEDGYFTKVIRAWESLSPFFKEMEESGKIGIINQVEYDGIESNPIVYNFLGVDFSEDNGDYNSLKDIIDKWDSRFGPISQYFGSFILDSCTVDNIPLKDKAFIINANQWEVRDGLGIYGNKGWFKVYLGDDSNSQFIIDEDHPLTGGMDQERTIDVPEELRNNFRFDLRKSLRDIAGINI
jgi:hypothetical protein|nr:MAG TPA: terminase [Bacteriophage sp.]